MVNASKVYNLTWAEFNSCLTAAAQCLREDSELVDVTLSAGGRIFPAHKLVLGASSPLLMELLKSTHCQHPVLMFAGISASDLEAILEFIYQGEVNIEPNQLPSLLQAAHYLDIQALSPSALVNSTKSSTETLSKHVDEVINSYVSNENSKQKISNNTMEDMINAKKSSTDTNILSKKPVVGQKRILRTTTKSRKKLNEQSISNSIADSNDMEVQHNVPHKDDDVTGKENAFNTFFSEFFDESFDNTSPMNKNLIIQGSNSNFKENNLYSNLGDEIRLETTHESATAVRNECNNMHYQNLNNMSDLKQPCFKGRNEKECYPCKHLENESDSSDNELILSEKEYVRFLSDTHNQHKTPDSHLVKKSFQFIKKVPEDKNYTNENGDKFVNTFSDVQILKSCIHSVSKPTEKKDKTDKHQIDIFSDDENQNMHDIHQHYSNCNGEKPILEKGNNSEAFDSHLQLQGLEQNFSVESVTEERKISDLPIDCKYCGTTIRQSRNLRRHIEMTHYKPKLKAKYKKQFDNSENTTENAHLSVPIASINRSCTDTTSVTNLCTASNANVQQNPAMIQKSNTLSSPNGNIMTFSSRVLSFPSLSIIPSQSTLSVGPSPTEIPCLSLVPNNQSFSLISGNPLSIMPNNSVSFISNNPTFYHSK